METEMIKMNRSAIGTRSFLLVLLFFCALAFLCACSQNTPPSPHYSHTTYTLELQGDEVVSDTDWVVVLEKDPAKDFVILNLTDIQLGTGEYLGSFDHIRRMVTALVEKTQPDLITVTGDTSYGCNTAVYGICSFIDSFGIPWAPVYGNHDFENSGMSPDTLALVFGNYRNCLFKNGPSCLAVDERYGVEAKGNYVVDIVEKQNDAFTLVKSLVFFNSRTNGITDLQIQWYRDCMESAAPYGNGSEVPSAVFMHIPIPEYRDAAYAAYRDWNASLIESYTEEAWNDGYKDSFGAWHEGVSSGATPYGFAAILKEGGNDLVVCGHDHKNCFCIDHEGMTYLFTLKTGPGCYYEEGMEGGTEISVGSSGTATVRHCFFYEGHGCYYTPQEFPQ